MSLYDPVQVASARAFSGFISCLISNEFGSGLIMVSHPAKVYDALEEVYQQLVVYPVYSTTVPQDSIILSIPGSQEHINIDNKTLHTE